MSNFELIWCSFTQEDSELRDDYLETILGGLEVIDFENLKM
jgi:hypothetical protein